MNESKAQSPCSVIRRFLEKHNADEKEWDAIDAIESQTVEKALITLSLKIMNRIIISLFWLVVLLVPLLLADAWFAKKSALHQGTVVDRVYLPSQTGVGTGTAVTNNGNVGVVTTTTTTSEKWRVIVSVDGHVVSAKASPELWASSERGSVVFLYRRKGLITGANFGWYLEERK